MDQITETNKTMFKGLKIAALGAVLFAAACASAPSQAQAGDYCREYTRTVYIGNRSQEAYGTACLQPDGSWMIVNEGLGGAYLSPGVSDVEYVIHDPRREVIPTRVVYYDRSPVIYRSAKPSYVWYRTGHSYNGINITYKKYGNGWGRDRDWNRGNDRDRGRGGKGGWDRDDYRGRDRH